MDTITIDDIPLPSTWTPDDIATIESELDEAPSLNKEHAISRAQSLLDELATLYVEFQALNEEKDHSIAAAIPMEIREQLTIIEEEYTGKFAAVEARKQELETKIREAGLAASETVKGRSGWKVTYFKGRVSWQTKDLETLAQKIPAILECRKEGKPYTAIEKA